MTLQVKTIEDFLDVARDSQTNEVTVTIGFVSEKDITISSFNGETSLLNLDAISDTLFIEELKRRFIPRDLIDFGVCEDDDKEWI